MTVRIITGDCLDVLRTLEDESVQTCVTSPPYWGLRDYGHAGQIGLEDSPDAFVGKMVEVFREVRRVLRSDGTLWLNLGDSYAGSGRGGNPTEETSTLEGGQSSQKASMVKRTRLAGDIGQTSRDAAVTNIGRRATRGSQKHAGLHESACESGAIGRAWVPPPFGLKQKDLCGMPWRVASALQQPYYTGKIKDERDRVWLAAMIDGEGCIFIHKRKAGEKAYSKFDRVDGTTAEYFRTQDSFGSGLEVANTSRAIVERCLQITGVGSICEQTKGRRQTLYRWNLRSNECRWVLHEVYPYFVAKAQQARLAIGCPSSGDAASAAHVALMGLHNGIASTVDFAPPASLHEKGWYLRQDCIWSKLNPMPESVTDRCTKAHEYMFLLSKSERYYFDQKAIAEPVTLSTVERLSQPNLENQAGSDRVPGKTNGNMKAVGRARLPGNKTHRGKDLYESGDERHRTKAGLVDYATKQRKARDNFKRNDSKWAEVFPGQTVGTHRPDREDSQYDLGTRNKRSVWTVATQPFKEAHFATFPPALIEPCVLAGCPEGGTVLDPFGGAGTTGLVADRNHRNAILIELNPEYAEMARKRIRADSSLLAQVE